MTGITGDTGCRLPKATAFAVNRLIQEAHELELQAANLRTVASEAIQEYCQLAIPNFAPDTKVNYDPDTGRVELLR